MKLIDCRYISRCKERRGESTALGWVAGGWSVIIPETALRKWFNQENPETEKNLYTVLGIAQGAQPGEIKAAYRRMALQWHPDRCKELNSHEVFLRIQDAYNVLSDERKRERYNAGLEFERSLPKEMSSKSIASMTAIDSYGYRSPLRCGYLLVNGTQAGKWFVVSDILGWEDITTDDGKTLVVNWVMGEDRPQEKWV